MRFFYGFVVCFLSWSVSLASLDTYRAGIIGASTSDGDLAKFLPLIQEAGKLNVDILVLPSPQITSFESSSGINNYDELVQTLSEASKEAGLYVIAHLLEKTRCNGIYEMIRSNLVFDRDGNVVSVYRKPVNNVANCTSADTEIATFTTDFGVKFGLLMDEDLVLQKIEDLKGLKNFVAAGAWSSDIPFLSVPQFASTWAFTNKLNLVSSSGIFIGRNGARSASEAGVTVVDLKKTEGEDSPIVPPVVSSSNLKVFTGEDLSQYIIRPLDVAASSNGYKETVCHDDFCCEFYIKTSFVGPKDDEVNYGLTAFNGIRHFGKYIVGTQMCSIFACAGLYKRTCTLGSHSNSTNVIFENISIRSNYTSKTSQYPIIVTTGSHVESNMFNFEYRTTENQRQVTLEVSNVENLLSFGIFGRDFSKDSEKVFAIEEELSFKDEMREMCDYLWIRLRILIFVVSIYFLEMM